MKAKCFSHKGRSHRSQGDDSLTTSQPSFPFRLHSILLFNKGFDFSPCVVPFLLETNRSGPLSPTVIGSDFSSPPNRPLIGETQGSKLDRLKVSGLSSLLSQFPWTVRRKTSQGTQMGWLLQPRVYETVSRG